VHGSGGRNVSVRGKEACTKFARIRTDGTHSIVLCEPVTGRTHQIRVHLQYTGHPIANDVLYLSEHCLGKDGRRAVRAAVAAGKPLEQAAAPHEDDARQSGNKEDSYDMLTYKSDPMCTSCPNLGPKGYDDGGEEEEGLWLHCIRYSGPGWAYECPYPHWASL
ncbi:hypothetical protein CRG98_042526, partial [Punica granatum]